MAHPDPEDLHSLLRPTSVAIVGASDDPEKPGFAIIHNIVESGFKGKIFPVNPGKSAILGLPCYATLDDIEARIDLAVIAIPAYAVIGTLWKCARLSVGSVIIISGGFRETGSEGLKRERAIAQMAQHHSMRVLGPNCLGLIDTFTPLNATLAKGTPPQGNIAFISQSGALWTSLLDIALAESVGFSCFVSLGNKADLNESDFLRAWSDYPEVNVVLAYLEGISDGSRFIDVARRFTKKKPIVAIKAGVTSGGSKAVSSHTGTLAGSERAYQAAFKQAGIIRARSMEELFDFALAFSRAPLPKNDRVAVLTNAGGPGIMATDAIERGGLKLAAFSGETRESLQQALPPTASILNPVDILGDATADRYWNAILPILDDPGVGSLLVILTPQFTTAIDEIAQVVAEAANLRKVPVLACFMGQASLRAAKAIFAENRLANYITPERAVEALAVMARQRAWQEKPDPPLEVLDLDVHRVLEIFEKVRAEGRLKMGDPEAWAILDAYRISIPASRLCATAEEAVAFADEIGYPVAMKVSSPDILHKTDIGGVRLNVQSPSEVRDCFDLVTYSASRYMPDAEIWGCLVQQQVQAGKEIIIRMVRDPQFGPLVMVGVGGVHVEAMKDVVFRVAPFSREEAMEMMRELKSFDLLLGAGGEARADLRAVADTLLKVSQLVVDFPDILELDINPLVVFEEGRGAKGIDMRLVLAPAPRKKNAWMRKES
ncbi:MAG: acetate--CoA ligase family protein [Syntrophorhabdales bacterium]|jgi:acetyltransferase